MAYTPTLKKKYSEEVVPALVKEFGYKSVMHRITSYNVCYTKLLRVLVLLHK